MSKSDESVQTAARTVCSFCGSHQFQFDRCSGCGGAAPEILGDQPAVADQVLKKQNKKTHNQRKLIGLLVATGVMTVCYLLLNPGQNQSVTASSDQIAQKRYMLLEVSPKPVKMVEPQVLLPQMSLSAISTHEKKPVPITIPDRCRFDSADLTGDFVVYASRGVGKRLNYQINGQGGLARKVEVLLNQTNVPVVLMLDAAGPTIWEIKRTVGTHVKAVFFNRNTHQAIAGMDDTLPIFANTQENDYPCGRFKINQDNTEVQDRVSQALFGLAVETVGTESNGKVRFGAPVNYKHQFVTDGVPTDSYRDKSLPLPGRAGIDQAIRNGIIRPASREDMNRWIKSASRYAYPADKLHRIESMFHHDAYLVVKPFTYPVGLNGGHRANFFIDEGVPLPKGDSGHSDVFDINTGTCISTVCRMVLSGR